MPRLLFFCPLFHRICLLHRLPFNELPAQRQQLCFAPVAKDAVMPDAHESIGNNVKQEAADELMDRDCHLFLFVVVSVISPREGDPVVLKGQDAIVGDGDPVGVVPEIPDYSLWPCKGRFDIDDPPFAIHAIHQFLEFTGILVFAQQAMLRTACRKPCMNFPLNSADITATGNKNLFLLFFHTPAWPSKPPPGMMQ